MVKESFLVKRNRCVERKLNMLHVDRGDEDIVTSGKFVRNLIDNHFCMKSIVNEYKWV